MELTELCSKEQWQRLEGAIREHSGLNAAVYNIDGIRLNPIPSWPNRLCPEIKSNPKGQSFICATAHMNIANQAKATRTPAIEECDAGMVKVVVPIFYGNTFLGAVGGCGLLLDGGEVDSFAVHKIVGMEEDAVEALSSGVSSISCEKANELASFIEKKLEEIVRAYDAGLTSTPSQN